MVFTGIYAKCRPLPPEGIAINYNDKVNWYNIKYMETNMTEENNHFPKYLSIFYADGNNLKSQELWSLDKALKCSFKHPDSSVVRTGNIDMAPG